ncbi:hypothetical protein [Ralstonia pseudosolanacearum]|uniref:hypothetical protein n=1 Tax=Ralstonia pseudosolanacearum TaxID=1310165 RepID=UPI00115FBB03|nr:hypothetical protein [Ralstonia pseudosolanacearum]MCL1622601.1 hypothetical protein [Ralstonia pseudosolanacearum CaRs-Mep]
MNETLQGARADGVNINRLATMEDARSGYDYTANRAASDHRLGGVSSRVFIVEDLNEEPDKNPLIWIHGRCHPLLRWIEQISRVTPMRPA